jgi:NTE family protein
MDERTALSQTALFGSAGQEALGELAGVAQHEELRSGEVLYEEGASSDAAFVVTRGRLRVTRGDALVGYVGRMEPVGEMGALMGEPRSATVRAVRDTAVLRIERDEFLAFLGEQAPALMALARLSIERLRKQGRLRMLSATEVQGTFAVIPASPEVPVMAMAEALVHRLSGWPAARLVTAAHVDAALGPGTAQARFDDAEAGACVAAWLDDLESRHRYLILAAGAAGAVERDGDAWALRCLHNADRVLVLAEAAAAPARVPVLSEMRSGGAPVELVLLRPDGDPSPHTLAWRAETGARAHYFLHPWDGAELASLARQVTARGVGLVLGGGGARGFAHIGLMRALEQLRIPVDVCGGTSMGAFMSALVAAGLDSVEMTHVARETFVRNNFLNDYSVPRVSLIRGRRFVARLREVFGDGGIEDLRRTYFCISTSLTTGATMVHDRGPLAVWVGTSMAVPGVAPPIAYEGELLCDGGVVDNLPTDVMQALERGSIIASNVSTEGDIRLPGAGVGVPDPEALLRYKGRIPPPRLSEILMRSATVTSATSMAVAAERADVYIRMPSQGFGMFDWKRIEELIEIGYEYALEQLTPLRETLIR